MTSKMKAARVPSAGKQFEIVDLDIPIPRNNEVLVKVEACGVCHGDAAVREGHWPGLQYPLIPGHEIIGTIEEAGAQTNWKKGQRVGIGWHGGHCFACEACRAGDFFLCNSGRITGITGNGGYAEYLTAPSESIASVPENLDAASGAPIMCAGITSYNALRHSGAMPGDIVAIQGIGGVGHMAVQYASKMGYRTIAVSKGSEKQNLSYKLGAETYIDSDKADAASELVKMGGAKVIFATAPNSKAISSLVGGLGRNGKMIIPAASPEPIQFNPIFLLSGRRSIQGWPAGTAKDSEEALRFSVQCGILPKVEVFPLEKAEQAYQSMITNKVRFRAVLQMK